MHMHMHMIPLEDAMYSWCLALCLHATLKLLLGQANLACLHEYMCAEVQEGVGRQRPDHQRYH